MNYRSHNRETLISAQKEGAFIFRLETDLDGEDDFLISYEESETDARREVLHDICVHFGCMSLDPKWKVEKVDYDLEDYI